MSNENYGQQWHEVGIWGSGLTMDHHTGQELGKAVQS